VPAVAAAGLSYGAARYWSAKNARQKLLDEQAAERVALVNRIIELEKAGALIAQQVLPLNAAFQAMLIKELTHFHTPVMDALMVKLGPPVTLTADEESQLIYELHHRSRDLADEIPQSERDAAEMLPLVMARVRADTATLSDMEFVAIPGTAIPEHEDPNP